MRRDYDGFAERSINMFGSDHEKATSEFKRILKWIFLVSVLMVVGALVFLGYVGSLSLHMVVATTLGVFFATLLGCGLFALAFFSNKSGHDQGASDSTRSHRDRRP